MGEEAALAHLQLGGEAADRQPFQPLDGGQVDRALEDRRAGPGSLGRPGSAWEGVSVAAVIGPGYRKARTFVLVRLSA